MVAIKDKDKYVSAKVKNCDYVLQRVDKFKCIVNCKNKKQKTHTVCLSMVE